MFPGQAVLDAKDIAHVLRVSPRTIRDQAAKGVLPFATLHNSGGRLSVFIEEVATYLTNGGRTSKSEPVAAPDLANAVSNVSQKAPRQNSAAALPSFTLTKSDLDMLKSRGARPPLADMVDKLMGNPATNLLEIGKFTQEVASHWLELDLQDRAAEGDTPIPSMPQSRSI
ncbi:MAG: helix-turn-helix domain-containing protein [Pseudomonadota bacterium]